MTNSELDAFLASTTDSSRCTICREHPELVDVIKEFMDRKAAGEHHLPLQGKKSLLTFLGTKGFHRDAKTVVRHVSKCMKVDHKTGRSL